MRLVVTFFLCTLSFSALKAPACGPFLTQAIFTSRRGPFEPEPYRSGSLGFVDHYLSISDLVIDYQFLTGLRKPSTPSLSVVQPPSDGSRDQVPEMAWKTWKRVRAGVIPDTLPEDINADRITADFHFYPNCLDPAFLNAARTLEARRKEFGSSHPDALKSWIAAQDIVFSNCHEGEHIPPEPEPGLPAILAADRRYQIASAHFYAGHFDEARKRWQDIASDVASPWKTIAPYLAARCLIREGSIGKKDPEKLAQAASELKQIAVESADAGLRSAASGMQLWVMTVARPEDRLLELGRALESPSQAASQGIDSRDFQAIWYRAENRQAGMGSDLVDWMLAIHDQMPPEEVLARWKQKKNDAWLIAALRATPPDSDDSRELLAAAARIAPSAPAFVTAAWYRTSGTTDPDRRRQLLDSPFPILRKAGTESTLNPFLQQRLPLSRNFDEFVRFAPRRPFGYGENFLDGYPGVEQLPAKPPEWLFDTDAAIVFNRFLPLRRWVQAIHEKRFTPYLTDRLTRAAWVRAILFSDDATALALSPSVRRIAPAASSLLTNFEKAATPEERRFSAIYAILKSPGFQPVIRPGLDRAESTGRLATYNRDNWWCPAQPDTQPPDLTPSRPTAPNWQSAAEKTEAAAEFAKYETAANPVAFLGAVALRWAAQHPEDPRSAEALHLVVRVSRYACWGRGYGPWSKQAFQALHKQFPGSEWAKKTPYWYGNDRLY